MFRLLGSICVLAALLTSAPPAQAAEAGRLVAVTDQDYDNPSAARIRLMDPAVANWGTAAAQKWTWSPTSANGFSGLTGAWGLPTDVKLRMKAEAYVAVVSDSRGLAALIGYPSGQRLWAVNVGSANNPHSVERPKSGCRTTWCTDTVDFAVPAATRTIPGAEIYKARVWSSRYE